MDFAHELPAGAGNKQLMFASPHVSSGWIPINSDLFHGIKKHISDGKYGSQVELLLEDLKCDYGLFAYCLRELSRMLSKEAPPEGFRPLQLIRAAGISRISNIFEKPFNEISRHNLNDLDKEKASLLSSAMTSACTAEVLAKNQDLDPDMAFSCALFRQLGITLIAWNYPHVYKRAITSSVSSKNLDLNLSRILGFSPTLLGISLAREWGISPEIRYVMGEKSIAASQETFSSLQLKEALALEKLCILGETLAQFNNSNNINQQSIEWKKARNEVLRQIGGKGLNEINKRLISVCKFYTNTLPETFTLPVSNKLIQDSNNLHLESLLQNNTYIQFLPTEIKSVFKDLYEQIRPSSVSKECIDLLVNKIMPIIGIEKGCIYLIDPGTSSLMPRLAIGNSSLNQYHPSNYLVNDSKGDPVLLAFRSSTPVLEKNITLEGRKLRCIAGSIGKLQRSGVLYIEPGETLRNEDENKVLIIFKALLQAIADCLSLS